MDERCCIDTRQVSVWHLLFFIDNTIFRVVSLIICIVFQPENSHVNIIRDVSNPAIQRR